MQSSQLTKSQAMHQAQIAGLSTFKWHPCDKCGCTERRAYSGMMCVECDRQRTKKYREANKERCAKMVSNWQKNNREYLRMKRQAQLEKTEFRQKLNTICGEYGLTLLEVVTAWGSRTAVINFYHQSEAKFRIICSGVKELSK